MSFIDSYTIDALQAAYAGLDNETPVILGNFMFRLSAANNPQIKTVAGTETVEIYNSVQFGAGAAQGFNFNNLSLVSATWTNIDDVLLTGGEDIARAQITPTATDDSRSILVTYWHPTATKVVITAKQYDPTLITDGSGVVVSAPSPIAQDFFRSGDGTTLPNGISDLLDPISRSGPIGIGQAINPISPLTFGDYVRNDVIRLYGNSVTNDHQFYGFGINNDTVRHQTSSLSGLHKFYGASSSTASKEFGTIADRQITIGSPLAPIGEGHFTIGTFGVSDNGYIRFNSPTAAPGANKIQAQIFFDGYGGSANTNSSTISFQTADPVAGSAVKNRMHITSSGDVLISDPTTPYAVTTGGQALLSVPGAIRIKGGPIVAGARQSGGLTFGATALSPSELAGGDTDGGITSISDNDISIYCNGVRAAAFSATTALKPGGGAWGALSDIRTKRDVSPHIGNLVGILDLEPIEYCYNGLGDTQDNGQRYVGFSAQALLQTDFAHWVTKSRLALDGSIWHADTHEPEDQLYQVDSSNLIYELLAAIKTQASTIADLSARIDALETKPKRTAAKPKPEF
jgi:hypothetical protein